MAFLVVLYMIQSSLQVKFGSARNPPSLVRWSVWAAHGSHAHVRSDWNVHLTEIRSVWTYLASGAGMRQPRGRPVSSQKPVFCHQDGNLELCSFSNVSVLRGAH